MLVAWIVCLFLHLAHKYYKQIYIIHIVLEMSLKRWEENNIQDILYKLLSQMKNSVKYNVENSI